MINVLKGTTCVVAVSLLAGCGALDPVNMILSARASSYDMVAEMTSPEMRNITLQSLRTADCPVLEGMIPIYQEDLRKGQAKADRVDIAVAEMNISVVKQIQGKNPALPPSRRPWRQVPHPRQPREPFPLRRPIQPGAR